MDGKFKVEIVIADPGHAEEKLFRALEYLLNIDDVVDYQNLENKLT